MKSFVGITGTTCVGKSAVAVELAKILQCDVISADSMQIYVGMDIGTAIHTVTLPAEWISPYMWVKTDEALKTINDLLNPYTTDVTEDMVEFYRP